jgi:hypothetical protein
VSRKAGAVQIEPAGAAVGNVRAKPLLGEERLGTSSIPSTVEDFKRPAREQALLASGACMVFSLHGPR